ncbi:hypothetical protein KSF_086920 [Reticulibacter mediterranei]|uniref:Uncharacterized protein n=1 Tax=Reticulibacter mediterranei TaxID=2778369 RepID=A0A8J3IVJ6_9CHLR|nr:hypothetical protein [Reticulibacter mediterranei]GHO98644.1 hypothetical protein KSF_086920 [Reticulibacter mediterranei]
MTCASIILTAMSPGIVIWFLVVPLAGTIAAISAMVHLPDYFMPDQHSHLWFRIPLNLLLGIVGAYLGIIVLPLLGSLVGGGYIPDLNTGGHTPVHPSTVSTIDLVVSAIVVGFYGFFGGLFFMATIALLQMDYVFEDLGDSIMMILKNMGKWRKDTDQRGRTQPRGTENHWIPGGNCAVLWNEHTTPVCNTDALPEQSFPLSS